MIPTLYLVIALAGFVVILLVVALLVCCCCRDAEGRPLCWLGSALQRRREQASAEERASLVTDPEDPSGGVADYGSGGTSTVPPLPSSETVSPSPVPGEGAAALNYPGHDPDEVEDDDIPPQIFHMDGQEEVVPNPSLPGQRPREPPGKLRVPQYPPGQVPAGPQQDYDAVLNDWIEGMDEVDGARARKAAAKKAAARKAAAKKAAAKRDPLGEDLGGGQASSTEEGFSTEEDSSSEEDVSTKEGYSAEQGSSTDQGSSAEQDPNRAQQTFAEREAARATTTIEVHMDSSCSFGTREESSSSGGDGAYFGGGAQKPQGPGGVPKQGTGDIVHVLDRNTGQLPAPDEV